MTDEAAENPFDDCELAPDAILWTRTFHDVLFTDDTETPVNALTGETPAHSRRPSRRRRSSLRVSIRTCPKSRSRPPSRHRSRRKASPTRRLRSSTSKATGSLGRHRAYYAAYDLNAFTVDFEADYESEYLTITVDRANES